MCTTAGICNSILEGFNGSVFSYGATGAGKTFTMVGNQTQPGLMFNTIIQLFKSINNYKSIKKIKSIKVSFLEIYNETIRDLIIPSRETLELREDPILGV